MHLCSCYAGEPPSANSITLQLGLFGGVSYLAVYPALMKLLSSDHLVTHTIKGMGHLMLVILQTPNEASL